MLTIDLFSEKLNSLVLNEGKWLRCSDLWSQRNPPFTSTPACAGTRLLGCCQLTACLRKSELAHHDLEVLRGLTWVWFRVAYITMPIFRWWYSLFFLGKKNRTDVAEEPISRKHGVASHLSYMSWAKILSLFCIWSFYSRITFMQRHLLTPCIIWSWGELGCIRWTCLKWLAWTPWVTFHPGAPSATLPARLPQPLSSLPLRAPSCCTGNRTTEWGGRRWCEHCLEQFSQGLWRSELEQIYVLAWCDFFP